MIVLDTHALVWWVNGSPDLSQSALEAIERGRESRHPVLVSAISAWEIAMLLEKGRMSLAMDLDEWLQTVESLDGVEWVPVTRQVAVDSVTLPGEFHPDSADRIIVALARRENADLVTADRRIHTYPHIRWIW